ncbi:hypothetical protein ACFLUV_03230 [Elusimicrobiota bacterium]
MKKHIIIFILLIMQTGLCRATRTVSYVWKNENTFLRLTGNYGTTVSENIKERNQIEKAYHIYNLLCNTGRKIRFDINLLEQTDSYSKGNAYFTSSLKIKDIEDVLSLKIQKEEKFGPMYDHGKLLYLKRNGDMLELETDGLSIFQNKEGFSLVGKKRENILIKEADKIKYLSEVDWLLVESLDDFSVERTKWVNENTIAAYVENEENGKKFIAIASIRKPDIKLVSLPDENLVDFVVSANENNIYILTSDRGIWKIYGRIGKKDWVQKRQFLKKVWLLGIRNNKVLWLDDNKKRLVASGKNIEDVQLFTIKTYPLGEYYYGEDKDLMELTEGEEKIILFYKDEDREDLKRAGIEEIDKFNGYPEVWVFPDNYRTSFEQLPERLGYVYFSLNNKKLYFDTAATGSIRRIGNIKLRPVASQKHIVIVLAILLVAFLLFDLLKKTKEYTS